MPAFAPLSRYRGVCLGWLAWHMPQAADRTDEQCAHSHASMYSPFAAAWCADADTAGVCKIFKHASLYSLYYRQSVPYALHALALIRGA